ncbi:ATP-grasp domain-containing protein (plasmid) [Sinorhizobium meliloti]|nr:ATP-grasp domain-containing protein [Sinorhizobium meliloti]WKL39640.1 ATP-grasp domain-containing protein [Sinorhizobium meliloti]
MVQCIASEFLRSTRPPPPCFVEVGHDYPAALPERSLQELASFAAGAVSALGIEFGPAHVEFVIADSGPVVIEVNPRLAGGMIPVMLSHALGTSILDMVINLYAGEIFAPPQARARAGAIRFRLADKAGRISVLPPGEYSLKAGNQAKPVLKITTRSMPTRRRRRVERRREPVARLSYTSSSPPRNAEHDA